MAKQGEGEKVEEKSNKRGHYKRVECPYCHKTVGNLGNHIKQKHPNEVDIPALDKEVLTGQKPPSEITHLSNGKTIYYCEECKAELRKGEKECWNCGTTLVWDGIE